MRRFGTFVAAAALLAGVSAPAFAAKKVVAKVRKTAPVQLTAAQMDKVTAGSNPHGTAYFYQNNSGDTQYVGDGPSHYDRNDRRSNNDKTFSSD